MPKSWKNLIGEDHSNANVEGDIVVRTIRWGDEIVLKSITSSAPISESEKREPVDLSVDSKYCPGTAHRFGTADSHNHFLQFINIVTNIG